MADPDNPRRRTFLASLAGGAAATAMPATTAAPIPHFAYAEASIEELGRRLANGEASSESLTAAYLERIAAIDRAGPELRAVIEVNPDAMAIAAERDAERRAGRARGPLHGVPILVKDNIASGDRMSTSAGCMALDGVRVGEDAPVLRRLREAGAVLLGKANLSEWANFRSSNSVSGWSSRGGQTRNPYAADRSPSGSSSGSAVAVAANLCAAAIGTETDGSITSPAACNNVVGLKPTVGLVSRSGIVPISHTQDTAGPMARNVHDCALLMNAMFGVDAEDPATTARGLPKSIDFTAELGRPDLKGIRLGVAHQYFGVSEKADRVVEEALAVLRSLGATLVDVEIPSFGKFEEAEFEVLLFEFKAGLAAWFKRYLPRGPLASLGDVIEYNTSHAAVAMPLFGQDLFIKAQQKPSLRSAKYAQALEHCRRLARSQGIDAVVKKHRVDAIVALTSPPPWLIDPVNGDLSRGGCTSLPAVAGYPHLTVPAGFAMGLPVGLSFFGPRLADAHLLSIGAAYERATWHRRAPA